MPCVDFSDADCFSLISNRCGTVSSAIKVGKLDIMENCVIVGASWRCAVCIESNIADALVLQEEYTRMNGCLNIFTVTILTGQLIVFISLTRRILEISCEKPRNRCSERQQEILTSAMRRTCDSLMNRSLLILAKKLNAKKYRFRTGTSSET